METKPSELKNLRTISYKDVVSGLPFELGQDIIHQWIDGTGKVVTTIKPTLKSGELEIGVNEKTTTLDFDMGTIIEIGPSDSAQIKSGDIELQILYPDIDLDNYEKGKLFFMYNDPKINEHRSDNLYPNLKLEILQKGGE